MTIQLDLFNNSQIDQIQEEIKVVRQRGDNMRRGLFARHNELAKMYYNQQEEFEKMRQDIIYLRQMLENRENIIELREAVI